MQLAHLIDLEVQLHRDEEALRAGRHSDLAVRDGHVGAEIARSMGRSPADLRARAAEALPLRRQVLVGWLQRLPADARPGAGLAGALRMLTWMLAVVAAIVGASAATATLHYDGHKPVNVSWFLGTLVLVQVALLVVLVLCAWRTQGSPLGRLLRWLAQRRWLGGTASAQAGAAAGRLTLHADAERWHLFTLAQVAALAFNLGALGASLTLVLFTDLAFGWSTTVELGAAGMHRLCAWVAWPWAGLFPEAVPSLELVRQSQWVQMPGSFAAGGSLAEAVASSKRWWSFLVMALFVWGLLPRALALVSGRWLARRALRAIPFDDHRCAALFDRLFPARAWQGPPPEVVGAPASERLAQAPHGEAPARAVDGQTRVLCWGRLAQAAGELARRLGVDQPPLAVGGADVAQDDAARATLAAQRARRVLLLVSAGNQPNKEVLDLLRALRADLGAKARLEVALVDDAGGALRPADRADLPAWYARLAQMGDPYLGLVQVELRP